METLYTKLGIQEEAVANVRDGMVMLRMHLPGQIQLTVSPSPGRPRKPWSECVKADVDVCNLEGIDSLEIWCEKDKPTAAYPRNWETICSLNIKIGFSKYLGK